MIRMDICWDCANRIIQRDFQSEHDELIGCNKLTKKQWEKGTCPLGKDKEGKDAEDQDNG